MTPEQVFARKYQTLRKDAAFRLEHQWQRLPEHIRDDVLQEAALDLWRQCRRGTPAERLKVGFSSRNGLARALSRYDRDRQRLGDSRVLSIDRASKEDRRVSFIAPRLCIRMGGGIVYDLADAKLDDPARFGPTIDGSEAARRLGVCRARVTQLAEHLGGRRVGRLLLFPADVADKLAAMEAETIGTRELARRLGVSENSITERGAQLGGFKAGKFWRFPADTGLAPGFKLPKLKPRAKKRPRAPLTSSDG